MELDAYLDRTLGDGGYNHDELWWWVQSSGSNSCHNPSLWWFREKAGSGSKMSKSDTYNLENSVQFYFHLPCKGKPAISDHCYHVMIRINTGILLLKDETKNMHEKYIFTKLKFCIWPWPNNCPRLSALWESYNGWVPQKPYYYTLSFM